LLTRIFPDGYHAGAHSYNAAGQVLTIAYASGATTTYAYDPERGWLDSVTTVDGGTTIQSFTYTHDDAGRITAINGDRTNEDFAYTYDALDRLTGADNANGTSLDQTFAYDHAGNLTSQTGVGSYTYPAQGASSVRPHDICALSVAP
jgi:YD repeat-containing protein